MLFLMMRGSSDQLQRVLLRNVSELLWDSRIFVKHAGMQQHHVSTVHISCTYPRQALDPKILMSWLRDDSGTSKSFQPKRSTSLLLLSIMLYYVPAVMATSLLLQADTQRLIHKNPILHSTSNNWLAQILAAGEEEPSRKEISTYYSTTIPIKKLSYIFYSGTKLLTTTITSSHTQSAASTASDKKPSSPLSPLHHWCQY